MHKSKQETDIYLKRSLPLIMSVSLNGGRILYPLGFSIPPKFWNPKTNRIKTLSELPTYLENKDDLIIDIEKNVKNHLKDYSSRRKIVTKQSINNYLNNIDESSKSSQINLDTSWELFNSEYRKKDGFKISINTSKKFTSTKNYLKEFIKNYYDDFNWTDLNIQFLRRFQDFLYDEKDCYDNTVAKYTIGLQQYLRFLMTQGVVFNKEILDVQCCLFEGDVHVVDLNELKLLSTYDFKDSTLNEVRDVFLFMCFTGQRYSDISKINSQQFSIENNCLVWMINTQKTKDKIKVPIVSYAEEVLKKYTDNNKELPVFCDGYFNRQIKVMAKYAGLERKVQCTKRKKGIVETSYLPICEVITSHVARKSFITNAIILGMQESEVKLISGHKDDRSFRRYVNLGNSVYLSAKNKFSKENIDKKISELGNFEY